MLKPGEQPLAIDRIDILAAHLWRYRRILLFGEIGVGKSFLAIRLLQLLTERARHCLLLELDCGSPPFGVPGTVSLTCWAKGQVSVRGHQALCTLDGGRFRLPLLCAARRLLAEAEKKQVGEPTLLIDPPGMTRGVGGAELLMALTESLAVDAVIVLCREEGVMPLPQELAALRATVLPVLASAAARAPARLERLRHRTLLWDAFLTDAVAETLPLDRMSLLGTPPPTETAEAWTGRQAALLNAAGDTVRLGEILRLQEGELLLRAVAGKRTGEPCSILIRDAGRTATGRLETMKRQEGSPARQRQPIEMIAPILPERPEKGPVSSNLGQAWATLVGGVFGDPLVHVRLRRLKLSLFFDLGETVRLAAKAAHQVVAVFLSHAHIDHIGGLTWFLRSRIGPFGPCRIFGPQETIGRLESFLASITWDRIDDRGPVFDVYEIGERSLRHARLQAGRGRIDLPEMPIGDGAIMTEKHFAIKAAVCDHNIPSIAYALQLPKEINIRRQRLEAMKLSAGPWLGTLKWCIAADAPETTIRLPDGETASAGELARELAVIRPGKKMAYAADMADTQENRRKIVELARGAHTLFCETAFTRADRDKADASQHLTTLAAVEIAREAGVERLVPFHFSKRYEYRYREVCDEIVAAAGDMQVLGC